MTPLGRAVRQPVGRGKVGRIGVVLLLAGFLLPPIAGQPVAAPKDTRPMAAPLTPSPPSRSSPPASPPAAAPTIPAQAATGMCQCIADHDRRNIRCLSSVAECQAACAGGKYSFIPSAPNCAVTAQGR